MGDGNSVNGPKIYKLNPNTGAIIQAYSVSGWSGMDPNGLEWDGQYLWHSDFFTRKIYKIDPNTWTVVKSFATTVDPCDLAWDGKYLYVACCDGKVISKVDPNTGAELEKIIANYASPNIRPFGLAYVTKDPKGELWTSDGNYGSNLVNQWSFAAKQWVNQWPSDPATYPCGLAYDPKSGILWVSCWDTDKIYKFNVGPQPPQFQYHFQMSPFANVLHVNVNPQGWINGYMNLGPQNWNPILGKYENGKFYMIVDIEPDQTPGFYETMFLKGTVSTRTGELLRTYDGLSYDGPEKVTLVPVAENSEKVEGPDVATVSDSQAAPQAWYAFQLSPYIDVIHLNTNPGGWLNGYDAQYTPNAPTLGFGPASGRFYFGIDFINPDTYYSLAFTAGTISTKTGEMIRTIDGATFVGPEPVTLIPK
jgi:DNA-binding beta-propeller fold protein YncE